MENNYVIRKIEWGSKEYEAELELREKILRLPLGMSVYNEDLSKEAAHDHFCVISGDKVIGTLFMARVDETTLKMRQVAVDESLRDTGIGRRLVEYMENHYKDSGIKKIVLDARKTAVGFYLKTGYNIVGDEFSEVGIPHYKMEKEFK